MEYKITNIWNMGNWRIREDNMREISIENTDSVMFVYRTRVKIRDIQLATFVELRTIDTNWQRVTVTSCYYAVNYRPWSQTAIICE